MGALINEANVSSNLQKNEELLTLLKEKIEKTIIEEKQVTVIISNSFLECRNTLHISDYEVYESYLYLNEHNFEIHIKFDNETLLKYDEADEIFSIVHKYSEIQLYF